MLLSKLKAWHDRHHHHTACMTRRISRKLGLDARQQAKFENLHSAWNRARAELQQVRSERDDMLEAVMSAPTIDPDEVLRMAQIPLLSFNEEIPRVIESYSDFHASLNQTQREQLLSLWRKRRHRPSYRH